MPPQEQPQASPETPDALRIAAFTLIVFMIGIAAWAWYAGVVTFQMPSRAAENAVPADLDRTIQGLQEISDTGSTSIPLMIEGSDGSVQTSMASLRDGVYFLSGSNADTDVPTYTGTVEIVHREGTVNIYDLTWKIEGVQQQHGVGILDGGILSVGYYEVASDDTTKDIGAVAYFIVDDTHLEGEWASVQGGSIGIERLEFKLPIRTR